MYKRQGEVHTDYHEEKPSVNLNESHEEVEPTVNFKKGAVTYVKMNETYNSGACESVSYTHLLQQ